VDFPGEIRRVQRRTHFRLRAPAGTEILFQAEPGQNEKGVVRDYSLGGVAFLTGKRVSLQPGDRVRDLLLRIPEGVDWLAISLPQGVVKRVEPDFYQGQTLYALQILELPESTRHVLNQHIFEKQRSLLRWVKK
jgi:c-di-GMP-binding flagellar brake protein YcgR